MKTLKKAKDGTSVRNTLSGGTKTRTVSGDKVTITKTDKAGNIIKNKTRNRIMQDVEGDPSESSGSFARKGAIIKKKMAKGGATSFGMLSVKAGIDKNPKPTAADRIAGAKKKKKK